MKKPAKKPARKPKRRVRPQHTGSGLEPCTKRCRACAFERAEIRRGVLPPLPKADHRYTMSKWLR